jgi:cell wall-associated NlpC family hydrolase
VVARYEVVATAREYLGVRWQHQGRTLNGVDCAGLVICVANRLGLSEFDTRNYVRQPDPAEMRKTLEEHMDRVSGEWQVGDVLWTRVQREPQHLVIVTDLGIIHASVQHRCVVEHVLDHLWRSRVVAAYSFRGVTE